MARYVVQTLDATSTSPRYFYADGANPAEALRETQDQLRRENEPPAVYLCARVCRPGVANPF